MALFRHINTKILYTTFLKMSIKKHEQAVNPFKKENHPEGWFSVLQEQWRRQIEAQTNQQDAKNDDADKSCQQLWLDRLFQHNNRR